MDYLSLHMFSLLPQLYHCDGGAALSMALAEYVEVVYVFYIVHSLNVVQVYHCPCIVSFFYDAF